MTETQHAQDRPSDLTATEVAESRALQVEQPTVRLIVQEGIAEGYNIESRARFEIRYTTIKDSSGEHGLHEHETVEGDVPSNLEIVIKSQGEDVVVTLPSNLQSKLLEYLTSGAPSEPFDCSSFVHFLYNIEYQFAHFDASKWDINVLASEEELAIGQAILINESDSDYSKNITHLAIYMGEGLYLSKFGRSGKLIVATLESQKVGFGGDTAWSMTPIRTPSL
jgi:hypothetical protein